ncbi:MAG: hypothetical protein ACHQUC_08160 [Chlamydiales bacterium]
MTPLSGSSSIASVPPPVNRTWENLFQLQWIEFVSHLLIERAFFQNNAVPPQLLLHLANELISALSPKKKGALTVSLELN